MRRLAILCSLLCLAWTASSRADQVLVEAESFAQPGGWVLDTQFIHIMGSPYLLAHGLGQPVDDATTTVRFPSTGEYRVWVRTKDWVAPLESARPAGPVSIAGRRPAAGRDLRHARRRMVLA